MLDLILWMLKWPLIISLCLMAIGMVLVVLQDSLGTVGFWLLIAAVVVGIYVYLTRARQPKRPLY